MTWSYSGSPGDSDKDAVRFFIGDTDTTQQLLSDEEINYALTLHNGTFATAAFCIDRVMAANQLVDRQVGDLRISAQQHADQPLGIKRDMLNRSASTTLPFFGGMTEASRELYDEDTQLIQRPFIEGQFDNPPAKLRGDGETLNSTRAT